jgi:isoleucyl-tRNA synthetase
MSQVPHDQSSQLQGAAFAIWTTTPWTIPANLAVAVNDKLQYSVVQAEVRLAMCNQALENEAIAFITAQIC